MAACTSRSKRMHSGLLQHAIMYVGLIFVILIMEVSGNTSPTQLLAKPRTVQERQQRNEPKPSPVLHLRGGSAVDAATHPVAKLLGHDTLLLSDGKNLQQTISVGDLPKEGVIGLYFSAHWCAPCRGFTPKLAEAYTTIKQNGKSFQIIFMSGDRDEESFSEYFAEQPWLALPFTKREIQAALSKKFGVSGIPSLILLDAATGKVITKDGRMAIMTDTEGKNFPWTPPTLTQAIGDELVKADGTIVKTEEALKDKYIGLYFSAHWCPPCKIFTPKLKETYNQIKAQRSDFEVVYSSGDNTEEEFKKYHGEMPWLAVPFAKEGVRQALASMYECAGIPFMVIVGPDGKVITTEGRSSVQADPEGADFPWHPKPVVDIETFGPRQLNDKTSLIAFCEGVDAEQAQAMKAALQVLGELAQKKAMEEGDDPEMLFCTATTKDGNIASMVRKTLKIGEVQEGKVALAIVDVPDNGAYYVCAEETVGAGSVAGFLADYRAKKLERKQIGQ